MIHAINDYIIIVIISAIRLPDTVTDTDTDKLIQEPIWILAGVRINAVWTFPHNSSQPILIIPLSVSASGSVNIPLCPWQNTWFKAFIVGNNAIKMFNTGVAYCTWYGFRSVWLGPYLSVVFWSRIVCERHEGVVIEDDRAPIPQIHVKPRLCNTKHVASKARFTLMGQESDLRALFWYFAFAFVFFSVWTDTNQMSHGGPLLFPERNYSGRK